MNSVAKRIDYKVDFDEIDGREMLNIDFYVKDVIVGSVELYLFNDTEEDESCESDEWLLRYYRPDMDDDMMFDPPIIAQGNL